MEVAPWELAEKYRKLSDEELVALWVGRADMTPQATEQLQLEMSNRSITDTKAANIAQEQAEFARVAELPTYIRTRVSYVGISYLGRRDRVSIEDGVEEFTSTRFLCFLYFPLIPLGSYRVRREIHGFWSRLLSLSKHLCCREDQH